MILAWDTETTGLPLFHEPSEHPDQPHIVELAAILVDEVSRKVVSQFNLVARPDGWVIPDEAAAIHGITTEHALKVGVPERDIVALLLQLGAGRTHVAHNSSFDERIVRIALKRFFGEDAAAEFKTRTFECTQRLATPILKLPPTEKMRAVGRTHFKSANLREAYKHFYGSELIGAHSAMADAQASQYVYFAIKSPRAIPAAAAGVHA